MEQPEVNFENYDRVYGVGCVGSIVQPERIYCRVYDGSPIR